MFWDLSLFVYTTPEYFDRWGAVQVSQNLDELGFTLVQFGQGFKDMSPPTKELMKLTLEQKKCKRQIRLVFVPEF